MNDPEVTMCYVPSKTSFIAHSKALEAAGAAIKLVMRVPAQTKAVAAVCSCRCPRSLNLPLSLIAEPGADLPAAFAFGSDRDSVQRRRRRAGSAFGGR
jgi:hypothetical protein